MDVLITVPRWSACGSGAWPGPRRWRRPCCSPRARTRRASPPCGTAGGSSGSPDGSRPSHSPRTGHRQDTGTEINTAAKENQDPPPPFSDRLVFNEGAGLYAIGWIYVDL